MDGRVASANSVAFDPTSDIGGAAVLRRTTSESISSSRRLATMAVAPDGAPAARAIVRHDIAEFTSRFNGQYAT